MNQLLLELKDYHKAREMLLKAIEIGNKTHNDGLLADSHLYLGKTFIAENRESFHVYSQQRENWENNHK